MITVRDLKERKKVKFICGEEVLIFCGVSYLGGKWYQLAKVDSEPEVWSEICEQDLDLLELV